MVAKKKGIQGTQSVNKIHRKGKNPKLSKHPGPIYRGLKPGWRRHTLIIREIYLDKIKDLSYWDRKDLKDVVDEALESYLNGRDTKPRPPGKR